MKTKTTLLASVLLAVAAAGCRTSEAQKGPATVSTTQRTPEKKSGHLAVNGVSYYYELHGSGEPVLLLHGGLMSIDTLGPVLATLAETRQVIAVDLHGHGRSSLGERKISAVDMGDDMAVIIAKLGFGQVDAVGYSLGGAVAFRLAVQHPESVRRLVLVSAAFSTEGFYPEMLPLQQQVSSAAMPMMKNTPMYQLYVKVAPHPEQFPVLLDRIGDFMRQRYDWSADLEKLSMPTLLVWGDSDMIRPEHMVEAYKRIGGGQRDAGWQRENMSKNRLAILPNVTHYDMFQSPALVPTVLPFIDGYPAAPAPAAAVGTQQ